MKGRLNLKNVILTRHLYNKDSNDIMFKLQFTREAFLKFYKLEKTTPKVDKRILQFIKRKIPETKIYKDITISVIHGPGLYIIASLYE